MIKKISILFFSLLILSCSDDPEINTVPTYQIGYELEEYNVSQNLGTIESSGDIIAVSTVRHIDEHYATGESKILIFKSNSIGEIVWTKLLSASSGNRLFGADLVALPNESFGILAQTDEGSVMINLTTDGAIISSELYTGSSGEVYNFSSMHYNNDRLTLTGSSYINFNLEATITYLNPDLSPNFSGKINTSYKHANNHSNSMFFAKLENTNQIDILKLNANKEVLWEKGFEFPEYYLDGLRKIVVTDDNIFIAGHGSHLNNTFLFVLDENGEALNGVRLPHTFGDLIKEEGSDNVLFLTGSNRKNSALYRVSPALESLDVKSIARLVGKSGNGIYGKIYLGDQTLNYQINHTNEDPLFGNRGFHISRIVKESWDSNCNISQDEPGFSPDGAEINNLELQTSNTLEAIQVTNSSYSIHEESIELILHRICE